MKKENFKKIIYYISIFIFTIYIIYRTFFTLSTNLGITFFIFSLLLLLIEIFDAFDTYVYFFNILIPKTKSFKNMNNNFTYPEVDIFIATYNEYEKMLSNTISKCLELNYPDKSLIHIYLCDDGNRLNIKKLAEKYNINYLSRTNRKNFKAGNYNYALRHSSSPYIAVFDADMAPCPDFLLKTIPYFFTEEKVGFIQLPQSFRNPDMFQYRFNLENELPFEQDYFYNYINIKKNTSNSTIFCGTNAVLSRQALIDANYFQTNSITEDIATGLEIESKGYKGIALSDVLVYGTSVTDFDGFIKQRIRWSRGGIQILKNSNFLFNKNLSIRQKTEYLSCLFYWFFSIKRLVFLIAPLLFILFNIIYIDCNLSVFLLLWTPTYLIRKFLIDICSKHKHSSTWSKIYEIILSPILFKETIKELLGLESIPFEVSPKSIMKTKKFTKTNLKLLICHSILLILNIIGYCVGFYKFVIYSFSPIYILPLFFILSNIFYLLFAIIFDTNNRNDEVISFVPNKISKYKLSTFISVFRNITWRKKNEIK